LNVNDTVTFKLYFSVDAFVLTVHVVSDRRKIM